MWQQAVGQAVDSTISNLMPLVTDAFQGRSAGEEIQNSMYDIYDSLEHDIRRTLKQSMQLQGRRDPKTGEITQAAFLPPALQYAVNSFKNMADIEVIGGLDDLTRTGIEGLDQIAGTLSGRGDITGGQRTQMNQGLRDRVLDAMLKTRRAGAAAAAGYEADTWSKFYGSGLETGRFSASGFQVPVGRTGFEEATDKGQMIGRGVTSFLESAGGMIDELFPGSNKVPQPGDPDFVGPLRPETPRSW